MSEPLSFETLLTRLSERAGEVDRMGTWPEEQIRWLADAGVTGWVIPEEYGGTPRNEIEMLHGYEQLAEACLTTCFILTQRNGACQRIAASINEEAKDRLLPSLSTGDRFATVGISHLTTSRQHLRGPAVQAQVADDIRLQGIIPWVTGAAFADHIVTGGTCEDGRQILVALPTDLPGVSIEPAAELMALTGSQTSSIRLDDVRVPAEFLLAGPVSGIMSQGSGGAGSLTTSTLALGLAQRAERVIEQQAAQRPDLRSVCEEFRQEISDLRRDLYRAVEGGETAGKGASASLRQRANSLVGRVTQAALAISKGAGYVRGHPAERGVREAMFFHVWSCPQPVVQGVLEELACRDGL